MPKSPSLRRRLFATGPSNAGVVAETGAIALRGLKLARFLKSVSRSLPSSKASLDLFPSTLAARWEAISPALPTMEVRLDLRVAFSSAALVLASRSLAFSSIFAFLAAAFAALSASHVDSCMDSMLIFWYSSKKGCDPLPSLKTLAMFHGIFSAAMPSWSKLDWLVLVTRVLPLTLRVLLPFVPSKRQSWLCPISSLNLETRLAGPCKAPPRPMMRPHSLRESTVVSDGVGRGLNGDSPPTTIVSPSGSPGRVSEEALELRESFAG